MLIGHPIQGLVHDSINLCELGNQRFSHLHYRFILNMKNTVTSVLDL